MNNFESRPENSGKSSTWGFLEDMASIGRLDMVLGDVEEPTPVPEETPSEENPDQQ